MNREYTLLDILRLTQCVNCIHLATCDYEDDECEDENKMCVYYEKEDGKWHKTE